MTDTSTDEDYLHSLDEAAALLLSVGRADLDHLDTGAALHCLYAHALLGDAGAQPGPLPHPRPVTTPDAARHAIRAALTELSRLPAPIFARTPILDAAHACHQALDDLA